MRKIQCSYMSHTVTLNRAVTGPAHLGSQATLSLFAWAAVETSGIWSSSCLASQRELPFQILTNLGLRLPLFIRRLDEILLLQVAARALPSIILTHVPYCGQHGARYIHICGHMCLTYIILTLPKQSKFYSLFCLIIHMILCSMLT